MSVTAVDRSVFAALERFAVLPAWLSATMEPGRLAASLSRHVPEMADGRLRLLGASPDRLRAKGTEWHAHCRVTVAEPGGSPKEVVLVGRLLPPGEPAPHSTPAPAFGEPGWHGFLPDLRLALGVQEADEALPALPSLVDPGAAATFLQRCLYDAGYTRAKVIGCAPEIVRYKPGSRCTIVYRMRYADGHPGDALPDPLVVKTHQGDKGAVAYEAMRALWDTHLATGEAVTLAEPLAYLPDERVLVQGPVPEDRTLKELARAAFTDGGPAPLGQLRAELDKTAVALAALHGSGVRYGRVPTWGEEVEEVREVVARLAGTVPDLADAAEPMLRHLEAIDATVAPDPPVSAHHDFRPAQVLLHQGRIGFIDFDGSCTAEPALDLGRFRGKLRDIGISALASSGQPLSGQPLADRLELLDDLCDGFLAAYQRHAPVSRDRVLLWETVDLLTAVLHAWTKVRLARVEARLAVLLHALRPEARGAVLPA